MNNDQYIFSFYVENINKSTVIEIAEKLNITYQRMNLVVGRHLKTLRKKQT